MQRGSIIAITAFVITILAGAAQAQQLPKVRIGWVVPVGNWASIIYEKQDLMTHYGKTYDVEPTHFAGTPAMITALAAGELDIADFSYSSYALAIQNAGMTDLRAIADEGQDGAHDHQSHQYFVLRDGPVKKVEDMKGRVVADVGAGAADDISIRTMLRRHGLEDKRDYSTIEASFPNMGALLASKKADLVSAVAPFLFSPDFQKTAMPLFTAMEAVGGTTQFVVWTAHADYIQKNRAALVDLLEDAVRAVRYLTDPKNHDAVVLIAAKVAKQPPEAVAWSYTQQDNYRDPNMMPDLDALQRAVDAQYAVGFLKAKLDMKPYADLSLVTEAAARIQ